ncbi:MAG: hypothetical protein NW224_28660 [Leptolyngbyaceae cyanobacterium bins.302]|nr:hypothetical protein [Leptolyngbyaceae cyanobacterium bins.302]
MDTSIFTEAPQRAIALTVQTWMQEHPIIAWSLTHPLISLGILLIAIVLLRGLLDAVARLTEWIWLAILRAPVFLVNRLFGVIFRLLNRSPDLTTAEPPTQHQQLITILDKLEALKQEQDKLLNEVRAMLKADQP